MAERRTIENWGARLNVPGEPLQMDEAMLLNLGHLNARGEAMLACLQDMQMRLHRMELFLQGIAPGYDEFVRQWLAEEERRRAEQEREGFSRTALGEAS